MRMAIEPKNWKETGTETGSGLFPLSTMGSSATDLSTMFLGICALCGHFQGRNKQNRTLCLSRYPVWARIYILPPTRTRWANRLVSFLVVFSCWASFSARAYFTQSGAWWTATDR